MIKKLQLLVLFFTFCNYSFAQEPEFFAGEVIVQFKEGFDEIESVIKNYQKFNHSETNLQVVERLSKNLNIWLLKFDDSKVNHSRFIQHLALNKNIIEFQNNFAIENRAIPNDPLYDDQWQYDNPGGSGGVLGADIDADLAWDITTGGVTPNGDTIVVCVIDDGLFQNQQDFGDNLWVNKYEIPNNGIDDDENGYIDDYLGFNANADDDDIYTLGYSHGTAVAGVVGAKGNNNLGVAGINWDVKLMIVKNNGIAQSQVIKAYEYPLEMRRIYNETGGARGAFVVAVNSSWGVNFGNPANAPLWCAFYDEMGEAGILNAAATANLDINVDVSGDLPTGCTSEYLISVTNIGRNDIKVQSAGYGAESIDMGAFGENALTISDINPTGYTPFGGTSAATPQVAGAIGLLYSAPCASFSGMYLEDPAGAALKAKEYIYNGLDENVSLQGITTTGGRLNLNNLLNEQAKDCEDCAFISDFEVVNIFASNVQIEVDAIGNSASYQIRYRKIGETNWQFVGSVSSLLTLSNLQSQTSYEYQVKVICDGSETQFSNTKIFSTIASSINALAIENGISIYPNPTKDIITIKLKDLQKDFKIEFFDISGKLIYHGTMPTQKKKIDISFLDNGIYLLKLIDEKGSTFTHKITKY